MPEFSERLQAALMVEPPRLVKVTRYRPTDTERSLGRFEATRLFSA